jgi:hypothetical protein
MAYSLYPEFFIFRNIRMLLQVWLPISNELLVHFGTEHIIAILFYCMFTEIKTQCIFL